MISVHMSFSPYVCLSIYVSPNVYLSICLSLHKYVSLWVCLPICRSLRPSISPSVYLSVCIPVCLSGSLPACLSDDLSSCFALSFFVCSSVHLTFCPSSCLSTFRFPSVSICLSVLPCVIIIYSYPSFCLSICSSVHLSATFFEQASEHLCKTQKFKKLQPIYTLLRATWGNFSKASSASSPFAGWPLRPDSYWALYIRAAEIVVFWRQDYKQNDNRQNTIERG